MTLNKKLIFSSKMTPQTSNAVRESIVQWLQVHENFLLITGAAGFSNPVVSGNKLKKKDAYDSLARFVNNKHKTSYSGNEMKRKYDWLLAQYKKANELSKTETDSEALEKKCPYYKELDIMFKERQNINPFNVLEPLQIPDEPLKNHEENLLSSSLESVHITDETKQSPSKKRKSDDKDEPDSPKKKRDKSSDESPFNSKTSSGNNGKSNFTNSYVANQKERFKMEKEIKEEELKLQRELKNDELAFEKEKTEKELKWKEKELEANIRLREKELEIQENVKKAEVKQTKMQLVKEMLTQGKTKEEIKEILEMIS